MDNNDYIIQVEHVTKRFDDGKVVLNDVCLNIKRGEFVTLLGPSGCGKTTLLRIIAGFTKPTEGRILLSGKDISELPPYQRPVNTVFQRYALFPHLNVYDNVAFGLKLQKVSEDEIDTRVLSALRVVGMTEYEERNVNELSGGQQQRVAIARAIVNRPQVLLLDEPLSALDHKLRVDMQLELKQMHRDLGITFIFVTHDQEEALSMSDTIVVMNDSVVQQIGTPTDIYNEPANPFVADFIGESNILNGIMKRDYMVNFMDKDFPCVDKGFEADAPIDVVIRPEDVVMHKDPNEGQWTGRVSSCIFKGIHYEMLVQTPDGYEIQVQNYTAYPVDSEVGMSVAPENIHVMPCKNLFNTIDATVIDATHVFMLGASFETQLHTLSKGTRVKVAVDFDKVDMLDDPADGTAEGQIRNILYKGNHYFIDVKCSNGANIQADTNDVWEDWDMIGINIKPEDIRVIEG